MRFFRHDGIYRSDVSLLLVNPVQLPPPVGRPRYRAIVRDGRSTPCPSSAMSSDRIILDRVGRHQSPSPLHGIFRIILWRFGAPDIIIERQVVS